MSTFPSATVTPHTADIPGIWQQFTGTSLDSRLERLRTQDPAVHALGLFHRTVRDIPAYRTFLRDQGVDPATVQTVDDFARVPLMTKNNYINAYPLPDRCRGGKITSNDMVAVSSGSTGEPTFWLRSVADELSIAYRFEQVFHDSFRADTISTLAVVCFPLGTWVGGMFTADCCRALAAKGYPVTVVTPGNNPDEILRVVRGLAPMFEQTVLLGYPPFLKDVVDRGRMQGTPWNSYAIKMVFAGEVFSEEWRNLVAGRVGAREPLCDFSSLYGTADAGVLGCETPLSIAVRRFFADRPDAAHELFGEARMPTIVQYDPLDRFFETQDDTLLFSGDNGIPLIRYHIADTGGVMSFADMMEFVEQRGYDPAAAVRSAGGRALRELPFVYVFGRSNFAVSYFGANVYPENITIGLEQAGISDRITGKFVLEVQTDEDNNSHLAIAVELAPGEQASSQLSDDIAVSVLTHLRRLNSEYAHYVPAEYALPRITLYSHGNPEYFPIGIKHRYTRR